MPHGLSSGTLFPRISLPNFRRQGVDVLEIQIQTERVSARDEPAFDRIREVKVSAFAVGQQAVGVCLAARRPVAFGTREAEAIVEALRRIEIIAGRIAVRT